MRMPRTSTRFSIVVQSLADSLHRLEELRATVRVRELRSKAQGYERQVASWDGNPPTEDDRAAMVKSVLELNVEVMTLGRKSAAQTARRQ